MSSLAKKRWQQGIRWIAFAAVCLFLLAGISNAYRRFSSQEAVLEAARIKLEAAETNYQADQEKKRTQDASFQNAQHAKEFLRKYIAHCRVANDLPENLTPLMYNLQSPDSKTNQCDTFFSLPAGQYSLLLSAGSTTLTGSQSDPFSAFGPFDPLWVHELSLQGGEYHALITIPIHGGNVQLVLQQKGASEPIVVDLPQQGFISHAYSSRNDMYFGFAFPIFAGARGHVEGVRLLSRSWRSKNEAFQVELRLFPNDPDSPPPAIPVHPETSLMVNEFANRYDGAGTFPWPQSE